MLAEGGKGRFLSAAALTRARSVLFFLMRGAPVLTVSAPVDKEAPPPESAPPPVVPPPAESAPPVVGGADEILGSSIIGISMEVSTVPLLGEVGATPEIGRIGCDCPTLMMMSPNSFG